MGGLVASAPSFCEKTLMCAAQSDKNRSGNAEPRHAQMIVLFQRGNNLTRKRALGMSISSSQDERLVPTVTAKENTYETTVLPVRN
jgi:hypothetical protein